jgi:hypothetical protein
MIDTLTLGTALRIEKRCECPQGKHPPIRVLLRGVAALQGVLNGRLQELDGETPFQTYRCRACKTVVILTLKDVLIVP